MRTSIVASVAVAVAAAVVIAAPPVHADGPRVGVPWVVSVGDSYISGEAGRWAGNTGKISDTKRIDKLGPTAYGDGGDPKNPYELIPGCHRSQSAEIKIGGGVMSKNLACSGATTATVVTNDDGYFKPGLDFYNNAATGKKGQAQMLAEFAAKHNVKMVALSIGGNDFGFGDVVERCVKRFTFNMAYCHDQSSVTDHVQPAAVAAIVAKIARAYGNIHEAMTRAGYTDSDYKILIQNYPQPLPPDALHTYRYPEESVRTSTAGCGLYDADSDWALSVFLTTVSGAIDRAIRLANLGNVVTLDLTTALARRRLCERGVSLIEDSGLANGWSRGASDRLEWVDSIALGVGDRERQESLHPNFWGQYALRNCLRQAYGNGSPRSGTCLRDPAGGLDEQGEPRMKLDPVPVRTFGKTVFAATANSYAGNIIGDRGSLRQQLDRGVRQIELAIRNDGAGLVVGKNSAGDGVDKTVGNPSSMKLDAWLKVVADWMHTPVNRSAAPVTLVLDARTALSSADDHTLNAMLRGTFQDRLFTKDPAKVPVGDLTGRVIPVLTGDAAARQDYVFTTGTDPAVAANAEGMVIAVNEYPAGALQYWSGRINSDGSVSWIESAKYDTGVTPSVALTDDGRLVEVHRAPTSDVLWYRLGTLGLDGHVSWKPVKDGKLSDKYADGMRPTLKFAGNNAVSEIHQRDKEGHRRSLSGSIGSTSVTWSGGHDTTVAFYPRQDALAFGWEVVVLQSAYHGSPGNTLLYKTRKWGDTAFGAPQRIIGPQVARIECRKDDSASLTAYLQPYCGFFGMAAGTAAADVKYANDQRAKGVPLRMWYFTGDTRSDPVPTFPATIRPRDTWYRDYIASHNYMW